MKNPIDQLIESAQEVRLTSEASQRIRNRLIAHMREHPISRPISSPYERFIGIVSPFTSMLRMPLVALTLVLLIAVGGATTLAATDALPGDPLYPLKVSVIEPVQGFLAVSPEEKAEFQISLVEKRVHEVEQLAAKEQLTSEQAVKSQKQFDNSLHASQIKLEELSRHNPEAATKIEISFTESLSRHEDDLNQFAIAASSSNANEARSFAEHIRSKRIIIQTVASTTLDVSPKETERSDKERSQDSKNQHENAPESPERMATSTTQMYDSSGTASASNSVSVGPFSDSHDSVQEKVGNPTEVGSLVFSVP